MGAQWGFFISTSNQPVLGRWSAVLNEDMVKVLLVVDFREILLLLFMALRDFDSHGYSYCF